MSMPRYDVLIIGGGHAGAQAAIALRQTRFAGTIAIVTDETELPYERPPLSKEYLSGTKSFERILLRPATFWTDRDIAFVRGARAVAVQPQARTVTLSDGRTLEYGDLIWAAGGDARRLSCEGHDLAGVHSVRTRADVDGIIAELDRVERVVVVGGGYIGLEAASALTKLGKAVTVVESLDRVLARVAGEPLSRFFQDEHRAHGVDLRLNAGVDAIVGDGARATGVGLSDGTVLGCDMVIVGIGIVPAVQPILDAGAAGGDGVAVDELCRTSLPHVFAIGDCAWHENAFADGRRLRLESVQNANDQAVVAARTIAGVPAPYHAVPWFWSNQYDIRLQTVGLSAGHDDAVLRGDPATRSFSVVYRKAGRVIALDCVNATRDYVQGRKLVEQRTSLALDRLADMTIPLKEMAAAVDSEPAPR